VVVFGVLEQLEDESGIARIKVLGEAVKYLIRYPMDASLTVSQAIRGA
jgi:hypothetical protein